VATTEVSSSARRDRDVVPDLLRVAIAPRDDGLHLVARIGHPRYLATARGYLTLCGRSVDRDDVFPAGQGVEYWETCPQCHECAKAASC
jgi:hypothetical protein